MAVTPRSASDLAVFGSMSGRQQAEERLALAELADLLVRRLGDAQDRVGAAVQVVGRDDRGAGRFVLRIGERRTGSGAALDEDVEPGRLELAERLGYQGDAPFSGRGLLGDTDLHGHHLGLGSGIGRERVRSAGMAWGRLKDSACTGRGSRRPWLRFGYGPAPATA